MWKIDASEVIIFLLVWLASIIKSMNESKLIHRLVGEVTVQDYMGKKRGILLTYLSKNYKRKRK